MGVSAGPLRVLLVDDDATDLSLITEGFETHRVPAIVNIAHDGVQALEYIRAGEQGSLPDLIRLDLNMPRMHGSDVLTAVKQDPLLTAIPVVVFTTSEQPDDITVSYIRHANA
jgi:CheY-like chemotaxis protein